MNETFISGNSTGNATRRGGRYPFLSMLASVIALIALAVGVTSALAQPGDGPSSTPEFSPSACEWSIVSSPNAGSSGTLLRSVAAVDTNDVWAVGYYYGANAAQTFVQHWNGSEWSVVPSPNVGSRDNFLFDVAAVSANDIWVVGWYSLNISSNATLVQHWNGSEWSVVSSPNVTSVNYLAGVAAVSADDVWAVGYYSSGSGYTKTLVQHWNGNEWSVVPSPNVGSNRSNYLNGVDSVSANDIWAVGYYNDPSSNDTTLVQHWNGSEWSVVPSPSVGRLTGVAVVNANDVWAVGNGASMHWNGSAWSTVPISGPDGSISRLTGVVAVGPDDVWAVGYYVNIVNRNNTVTVHWDGTAWSVVSSPNGGSNISNYLYGVDAVSANDIWAVGYNGDPFSARTLIEHYSGDCTPPEPTATPVPPTATPTPCVPGQFSDVPPDHTFYPYVSCLVDREVMSGYADCTFRPSNNLTRGQLAKVVSNAANFTEPHSSQTFEDVPSDHTFFVWIERLASRGIIGGYECGGENEPCVAPDNRPYFRSGNNVTRGQTAKIVAIGAGLPSPSQGSWTFQDVPSNHTFWQWIEALSAAEAIGGYGCGGEGEPCVAPDNRPYFRSGNNVTRGQASKIVASTYFPDCQVSNRR
jgi:hypothetical protein